MRRPDFRTLPSFSCSDCFGACDWHSAIGRFKKRWVSPTALPNLQEIGSRRYVPSEDQTCKRYRRKRLSPSLFAQLIVGYSKQLPHFMWRPNFRTLPSFFVLIVSVLATGVRQSGGLKSVGFRLRLYPTYKNLVRRGMEIVAIRRSHLQPLDNWVSPSAAPNLQELTINARHWLLMMFHRKDSKAAVI